VARLIGYQQDLATRRSEAARELRAQRLRYTLGGIGARDLRAEGRA